ncbi:MAG TPA: amylo-alpha-1,6-glucosidase [Gemmatimonadales bacterium]|nr:amylo-alpha-1,6-glucosidase [Gemmatimonadales bacterium]
MLTPERLSCEYLETDGLGGFASGTVGGWRTRRYHGLLTPAVTPPSGRAVLVDGFEAWLERNGVRYALSTQRYLPDVTHPDGVSRLAAFTHEPWPTWTFRLEDGFEIVQELLVSHERSAAVVRWSLPRPESGLRLIVRPLLSGRDSHALHYRNEAAKTAAESTAERVRWRPYASLPAVLSLANATYRHDPVWYTDFLLEEERARGFEHRMDLLSPGELVWPINGTAACWVLAAEQEGGASGLPRGTAMRVATDLIEQERERRAAFGSALARAGDAYLVRRGKGKTIIAGYPWFTDWGRDTFIALRGLCLATGRLDDARAILLEWAGLVSQGMLPNRFLEQGDEPEFNSVDASLWYIVAVHEFLEALDSAGRRIPQAERRCLERAVLAILEGYSAGTRYGIRMDDTGLLESGAPGVQLTWMDAKVGDWVVTPRIGKPVEIQALWINALLVGARFDERWGRVAGRATATFRARFWNDAGGLYDVIDDEGRPGALDTRFRPNQLFAVGGLPWALLEGERARGVVDAAEARLWTPMGPRSLAANEPGYAPRYEGGPVERDGSYHQGTVWPWLAGAFIEAWVRTRGNTPAAKAEARRRFFDPLLAQRERAGLGHLAEIADADPPHTPRGCPFQAWSMGELLRLDRVVLATPAASARGAVLVAGGAR